MSETTIPCLPCYGRGVIGTGKRKRLCKACVGTGHSMSKRERVERERENAASARVIGARLSG